MQSRFRWSMWNTVLYNSSNFRSFFRCNLTQMAEAPSLRPRAFRSTKKTSHQAWKAPVKMPDRSFQVLISCPPTYLRLWSVRRDPEILKTAVTRVQSNTWVLWNFVNNLLRSCRVFLSLNLLFFRISGWTLLADDGEFLPAFKIVCHAEAFIFVQNIRGWYHFPLYPLIPLLHCRWTLLSSVLV